MAASKFSPLAPEDMPAVLGLAPQTLRLNTTDELERHLLHNPYFPPEAVKKEFETIKGLHTEYLDALRRVYVVPKVVGASR